MPATEPGRRSRPCSRGICARQWARGCRSGASRQYEREAAGFFPRRPVLADTALSVYKQALVGPDRAAMAIAKWIFPGLLTVLATCLATACVAAPTPDLNRTAMPPPDVPKVMNEALVPGLQMA